MGKKTKSGNSRRGALDAPAATTATVGTSLRLQPWPHYEELLQGLLSIQIEEPFVDRDQLCQHRAWLVLHLDLVRPIANIHSVLDALAVLCVRSTLPQLNTAQHDSFWRDVLTSDVMRDVPSANAPSVFHFVAATRVKGLHVLLSWRSKRFQAIVATHVRSFLMAPLAKYEDAASADTSVRRRWWRPLRVGIQFGDALMTRDDLQTVKQMLTYRPEDVAPAPRLCEQHTLQRLDLAGNRMSASELSVLSSLLEDPQCRRMDALDLSNTFPSTAEDDAMNKTYISAFRRMALAVLTSKPNLNPHVRKDAGVALSIAHNLLVDDVHLHGLYDALASATRPLRGLSLAYTSTVKSQLSLNRKWFARLSMASPVASFTKDCVLDITCADARSVAPHDMDAFYEQLIDVVVASVPRTKQALAQNQSIYCRVRRLHAAIAVQNVDYLQVHEVLQIREDGFCLVALPTTAAQAVDGEDEQDQIDMDGVTVLDGGIRTCWVPPQWLSALYRDRDDATLRMRFSSLICHGDNDAYIRFKAPDSAFLGGFLASVGPEVQRLALRRWHDMAWILPRLLPLCPRLRELDLQSSRLIYGTRLALWELLSDSQLAQLEAVNVAGTDVNVAFLETLLQRVDHVGSLRYLSMVDCTLCFDQLRLMRRFLQLHKRLELLEMDGGGVPSSANDEMTPTTLAMAISRDHNHEQLHSTPLPVDQRVMVAWCLSKIPQFEQESEDCAAVVQFAGDVATRHIRWCSVVRLPRWVLATRPRY